MPRKSPSRKAVNDTAQPVITNVVDQYVDAPPGIEPERWHILLNKQVANYAEQYKNALMQARGIPFNQAAISVADPLVIILLQKYFDHIENAQQRSQMAIREAMATYERWAHEADQDSWVLALLYDNKLKNDEPTPYEWEEAPPGVIQLEAPRNLSNPAERRLKQLIDVLDIDPEFDSRIRNAVNGAIAEAIQIVTPRDAAGFQS